MFPALAFSWKAPPVQSRLIPAAFPFSTQSSAPQTGPQSGRLRLRGDLDPRARWCGLGQAGPISPAVLQLALRTAAPPAAPPRAPALKRICKP